LSCNQNFLLCAAAQNVFADFISLFGKLFLILCHDISDIHDRIVVKIVCDLRDFKGALLDFFHGKVKQPAVICLKFNDSALYKDPVIAAQIFGGGKTPSCMSFLGPGI
jgi:hypothetical protein